jgi:hypothetical protein
MGLWYILVPHYTYIYCRAVKLSYNLGCTLTDGTTKQINTNKQRCVDRIFNIGTEIFKYSVIKKDGLNFVRLYFLNCTWYVNDLYNI